MTALAGYIGALVAFVAADMIWLGFVAERLYRPTLASILAVSVNLPAAVAFYLIFPVGLTVFAVAPATKSGSLGVAASSGFLTANRISAS